MIESLFEKIVAIRKEPEHVRMRYVVLCVTVSMIFIVSIWLLSVQESVTTAARDIPQVVEQGKDLTGGAPTLNNLFEQSAPLRVEEKNMNGSEFFDQQVQGQSGSTMSEGVGISETGR